MGQLKSGKILAMVACWAMIMPQSVFAGDGTQWQSTPTGGYTHEVPALPQGNASQIALTSQTNPSSEIINDLPGPENNSPISLSHPESSEDVLTVEQLTDAQATQVLELLSETLAVSENDPKLSEADAQNYAIASAMIRSYLAASSEGGSTGDANPRSSALEMLRNVREVLGRALSGMQGVENPSSTSPENLFRRFVTYVTDSIQATHENMTEGTLLPRAKSFSAGESSATLREEKPILSVALDRPLQKNYQVLGSVVLNRETAKTYELLNPPQKLQPFVRWLFYGRHLTTLRAERYLAARAKVKAMVLRAKAGEGLIRYNGKIMEMFLPLPGDEVGGTFELVRRM